LYQGSEQFALSDVHPAHNDATLDAELEAAVAQAQQQQQHQGDMDD
jgi:hypothetical protein